MILRGHVKESLIPSLVERIGLLFWKNCLFSEGNGLFSRDSWPLARLTYNVLFCDLRNLHKMQYKLANTKLKFSHNF